MIDVTHLEKHLKSAKSDDVQAVMQECSRLRLEHAAHRHGFTNDTDRSMQHRMLLPASFFYIREVRDFFCEAGIDDKEMTKRMEAFRKEFSKFATT